MHIWEFCVPKKSLQDICADALFRFCGVESARMPEEQLSTMKILEVREGDAPGVGMNAPRDYVIVRIQFDWPGRLALVSPFWSYPRMKLSELEILASEGVVK